MGKDQVSHSKLQLRLSADKLTMKLEILLDELTIYTVTVLLFGKNIRGSPLLIPAKGPRISVPIPILVEERVDRRPSPAVVDVNDVRPQDEKILEIQNSHDPVTPATKNDIQEGKTSVSWFTDFIDVSFRFKIPKLIKKFN